MTNVSEHHYLSALNGAPWTHLEMEEQASVRKLMRLNFARIVDRKVQIRQSSCTGYPNDYVTASKHVAVALGLN